MIRHTALLFSRFLTKCALLSVATLVADAERPLPSINGGIFVFGHLRLLRDGGCIFRAGPPAIHAEELLSFVRSSCQMHRRSGDNIDIRIQRYQRATMDLGLASLSFRKKKKKKRKKRKKREKKKKEKSSNNPFYLRK